MQSFSETLFALSDRIRYVAIYKNGNLHSKSVPTLSHASSLESDRYEELLVNPAILLLTRQRGEIDCGGLHYVLVRYGNFFQFVRPIPDGHLSVCIQPDANLHDLINKIQEAIVGQV